MSAAVTHEGRQYPALAVIGAADATKSGELIVGGLGATGSPAWEGKIVLLDRGGDLTFATKVKSVADSKGIAAIIANDRAGINPATLAPDSSSIPAVTISQVDGTLLKAKAGQRVRVGEPNLLPDPLGHPGELLVSDGVRWVITQFGASSQPASPPVITTQPVSISVPVGGTAKFMVGATGTDITFQWSRNGTAFPGWTGATLEIVGVTSNDVGNYVCTLTNEHGSTTSDAAVLTIR